MADLTERRSAWSGLPTKNSILDVSPDGSCPTLDRISHVAPATGMPRVGESDSRYEGSFPALQVKFGGFVENITFFISMTRPGG